MVISGLFSTAVFRVLVCFEWVCCLCIKYRLAIRVGLGYLGWCVFMAYGWGSFILAGVVYRFGVYF